MYIYILAWLLVFSMWIMYINERSRSTYKWWNTRDIGRFEIPMTDKQYYKVLKFGDFKECMKEIFEKKPYQINSDAPKFHEPAIATGIFGVISLIVFYLYWTKPSY